MARYDDHGGNLPAPLLAEELRAFSATLKRRLREQADTGDLPPSHTAVISRLDRDGPLTTSSLARAEGMRPQSMGTIVAALQAAGLIKGAADPQDGRQTLLSLTAACRTWLVAGRATRQDWLTRTIAAALTDTEQTQLAEAMPLLRRLVDR